MPTPRRWWSPVASVPRSGALRGRGLCAMRTSGRVPSRSPSSHEMGAGEEIPARGLTVKPMWRVFHDELYLVYFAASALSRVISTFSTFLSWAALVALNEPPMTISPSMMMT